MSDQRDDHRIIGIHITDRVQNAGDVQRILSKYGKAIRTRVGLHDVRDNAAAPEGLILLETVGSSEDADALSNELRRLPGVQVQSMFFSHPQ
jgi:hypothetical protein